MANLIYSNKVTRSDPNDKPVVIIGQLGHLASLPFSEVAPKLEPRVNSEGYRTAVKCLHPSPTDSCSLWFNNAVVASLPLKISRHNCPSRAHHITKLVRASLTGAADEYVVIVCEKSEMFASGCAVARAFPLFTRKSSSSYAKKRNVTVEFVLVGPSNDHVVTEEEVNCLQVTAASIRQAAFIVDMPCNEMHTDRFVEEAKKSALELGITPVIIQGEELNERGFGGLYGVGKASANPPALVVLSHMPANATQTIAWVGKGIVYDTGGLSIKGKTAMPGMKRDCGGAAAILGAFVAAVKMGFNENLHAVLCLAENSVGPLATRPDDIHKLYSGRTVEINNTDAEGRLVLGDGVAYAVKDLKAEVVVDMATLTGAQAITTGKLHAAVLTNSQQWEEASVRAGRSSGDMTYPIIYAPEIHFPEFASAVADMKNSVANRSNAQCSCAGLFIEAHLGAGFSGSWVHFDIADPAEDGERATGYGVALLLALFGKASQSTLLNSVSPQRSAENDVGVNDLGENACKKQKFL